MGVWIEISDAEIMTLDLTESHPLWVCGLKLQNYVNQYELEHVTPFMGVWIEIYYYCCCRNWFSCHTLYGCVD